MRHLLLFILFWGMIFKGYAQPNLQEQKKIETLIQPLGGLEAHNLATITDTITRHFFDKRGKALAIYYWIANNIILDPGAVRSNDARKTDPSSVIQNRKTNAIGFSMLFQEMCSMADIRCLIINGYTKYHAEDINEIPDEPNHAWNVVQIGMSPDKWFYVDVAKASGIINAKYTLFTKKFDWNYFFAERNVFNLDHFPDNLSWLLGSGAKSKKSFFSLPLLEKGSYTLGISNPTPSKGFIKTKTNKPVLFKFNLSHEIKIWKTYVLIRTGNNEAKKIDLQFSRDNQTIYFEYTFKDEDTYTVTLNADDYDLFTYMVESEE